MGGLLVFWIYDFFSVFVGFVPNIFFLNTKEQSVDGGILISNFGGYLHYEAMTYVAFVGLAWSLGLDWWEVVSGLGSLEAFTRCYFCSYSGRSLWIFYGFGLVFGGGQIFIFLLSKRIAINPE